MNSNKQSRAERMYSALLRVLPFDFRSDFGSEMEDVFREQRRRAERDGKTGLLRLWWDTIVGMFQTAPREHLSILRQDFRYALRMMKNNPGYTAIAVLTLALGIGANTAIFSVIDAVLVRPLPYNQGNQLVQIHQAAKKLGPDTEMAFSVPEINDYRARNSSLSGLVEYHGMQFTLFTPQEAQRVRTGVVSPGFFELFGVKPILGRTFTEADDRPGAPAVLVLSYEYWKQRQGGDPNIVGKTFELNDRIHTVVGVLPPVPQYPNENDVYMPTSACPFRSSKRMLTTRSARMMSLFGRLKPGVTEHQCNAEMAVIASQMERDNPKFYPKEIGFAASSSLLKEELTRKARPTLLVLMAAAGFVLLIACANVANLTLARMARRERELVVRSALGAGKGRLLRQLVTESFIMGILSAAVGVLFAYQSVHLLTSFAARLTPRAREIHMDAAVLLFAVAAAAATSIVFGSMSALYSRQEIAAGLKDGGSNSTAGRNKQRARNVLVVCQVAFSFVLLVGAGLMLRSFAKLQQVDAGFVPQHVLAVDVGFNWSKYSSTNQRRNIAEQVLRNVQAQPGVLSAATASGFPLDPEPMNFTNQFFVEGREQREGEPAPVVSIRVGSPDYFRTLGIRLLQGREFHDSDNADAPLVAVINESTARHYWPTENPIGRRISTDREHWRQIVGVVGDVREFGLDHAAGEEVYFPNAQLPATGTILVRTAQDPMTVANQVRRAILDVDPQTAIPNVQTLEQARSEALAPPRVMTNLLGIFAALALVIAVAGIGGVLALTVSQRVNEIGVRVALGAKPGNIIGMVLGRGMALVAAGLLIGVAGAFAFTRLLQSQLFEVRPTDPLTFAGVSVVFAVAAFAACYLPARRASRIDPLRALRSE